MSTTDAILRSYTAPRVVMRRHRAAGADEGVAMTWLVVACIIFFVARLPGLARTAHFAGEDVPIFGLALGTFFGTILLAPALFYAIAALSHLVARLFGGQGGWLDARLALFWSLLAASPMVLFQGLVTGFIGDGPQLILTSTVAFGGFLFIWINSLVALEHPDA